ncbi:MAG: DUF2752 domain-containing protein [Clostridia bacterium]|nr:DUF2752 domain-containing protein [Clostridia bacterium]
MHKVFDKTKGLYNNFCEVILYFDIFLITYPLWHDILTKINPILTECNYKKLTGNDCPFCYGTRTIRSLWTNTFDIDKANITVLNIFIVCLIKMIYRVIYFITLKVLDNKLKENKITNKKYNVIKNIFMIVDLITIIILLTYVAYIYISFIITNIIK